jgi:hypothetical protein
MSLPTIVAWDLARIVQTHEVPHNNIWLPSMSGAVKRRVLPSLARKDKLLASGTDAKLQNESKHIIIFSYLSLTGLIISFSSSLVGTRGGT